MGIALQSRITPIPRSLHGFRVFSECRPAEEVAGDFYAITMREPRRLGIVIGDACGRGREGAALLPEIMPAVRELMRSGAEPGRLLTALNQTALGALPIDRFITAAALELDADLCTLAVANAGHVPALVRGTSGRVRIVGRASGPPLGVVGNACYREERLPLAPGETVVLMTDGVLEAVETDLCAMHRLRALVHGASADAASVGRVLLDALEHAPRERQRDDVTLLCIEFEDVVHGRRADFGGAR